jgi:hypothetical protein
MPSIGIADSFLDSLTSLDPVDVKRVARFLEKLLQAPETTSLRPEIVHDASDRSVRSFKVTHDLRAISRVADASLTLLFVGRHDRAYAWARARCIDCHAEARTISLDSGESGGPAESRTTVCATAGELCRLLATRGIDHGLTA